MSSPIIKQMARMSAGLMGVLATHSALAGGNDVLRLGAQVCVEGVPGLTDDAKMGIDAVEGWIRSKTGRVDFMISRNPNIPAAMNIARDRSGYVLPKLSGDVTFVAESKGALGIGATGQPIGHGTERLYAFVMRTVDFPDGPVRDTVFIQLWSNDHQKNVELLKKVGDGLRRCK